jgi:hypothetical protein
MKRVGMIRWRSRDHVAIAGIMMMRTFHTNGLGDVAIVGKDLRNGE